MVRSLARRFQKGREVSRAAWLLIMATFALVCLWTPLSVAQVARRWFAMPASLLFIALAVALVAVSIAFWRSIWSSGNDARLLQLAVAMTVLAFVGFGGTIWPYAIPYRISILEGAADLTSIRFRFARDRYRVASGAHVSALRVPRVWGQSARGRGLIWATAHSRAPHP